MTKRYFFIFAVLTFLLTLVWVASNVYHGYADSSVDPLLETQIQEIPESFDIDVISDLKKRQQIAPDSSVVIPSPSPGEESEQNETSTIQETIISPSESNQSDDSPGESAPSDETISQIQ